METMIKFDTNEDDKYVSMYMNEACDKIESDIESTPLNGKVKKLYYGKEYFLQNMVRLISLKYTYISKRSVKK